LRADVAVFDAANPAPISLDASGITLGPGACEGPLVVIANAVLSELPVDCFLDQAWVVPPNHMLRH